MGKLNTLGYSLSDVCILPACVSDISSRSEVNVYTEICGRESYPIFVAPMAAVTDENNYKVWIDQKLTPVVPRSVMGRLTFEERLSLAEETFVSISLSEAVEFSEYEDTGFEKKYICIDLANGHMKCLLDVCKKIKDIYGDRVEIMTGNIANASVYPLYCEAGIDYVRCGIGNGSRCTSANAVGIHCPNATLLDDVLNEKHKYFISKSLKGPAPKCTKIILDGGISWYDDINKALAIGADAVMIGKLFAECEEACGEVLYSRSEEEFVKGIGVEPETFKYCSDPLLKPYRNYAGMSHRSMQKITGGDGSKVSEGIQKPVEIKYPVSHWINNMDAYLRSAMSYTNSKNLADFKNSEIMIFGGVSSTIIKK